MTHAPEDFVIVVERVGPAMRPPPVIAPRLHVRIAPVAPIPGCTWYRSMHSFNPVSYFGYARRNVNGGILPRFHPSSPTGQIGYEDIVAEAGAADEYRAQLARIRAQLAAARATMPSVLPSQEKVVLLRPTTTRTSGNGIEAAAVGAGLAGAKQQQGLQSGLGGGTRILTVSTPAPGSYRYTTLEDTLRLIDATRPYAIVGVSG